VSVSDDGTLRLWDLVRPLPFKQLFPDFEKDPLKSVKTALNNIKYFGRPEGPRLEQIPDLNIIQKVR
jgi:hypothetical protein